MSGGLITSKFNLLHESFVCNMLINVSNKFLDWVSKLGLTVLTNLYAEAFINSAILVSPNNGKKALRDIVVVKHAAGFRVIIKNSQNWNGFHKKQIIERIKAVNMVHKEGYNSFLNMQKVANVSTFCIKCNQNTKNRKGSDSLKNGNYLFKYKPQFSSSLIAPLTNSNWIKITSGCRRLNAVNIIIRTITFELKHWA